MDTSIILYNAIQARDGISFKDRMVGSKLTAFLILIVTIVCLMQLPNYVRNSIIDSP